MRWLLRNGGADRCRACTPDELCPKHEGAPEATPAAIFLFTLYNRVRRWNSLPHPGGLLDQEETLMRRLDLIRSLQDEYEHEQEALSRARADAVKGRQLMAGGGGARILSRRNQL